MCPCRLEIETYVNDSLADSGNRIDYGHDGSTNGIHDCLELQSVSSC